MNIAFLGMSTEDKKFLILCLAKIASHYTKVKIITKHPYAFEKTKDIYEYFGVDILLYRNEEETFSLVSEEECIFLDIEEFINIPKEYRVIAISEPTRRMLEFCVNLTGEYAWFQPAINISLIHLNIMEYCKVGKKYLDFFWEHGLPSFTRISSTHSIYFEETNRALMIESQYSNKLSIRKLSVPLKIVLKGIIQDIFSLDSKEAKVLLKQAERTK